MKTLTFSSSSHQELSGVDGEVFIANEAGENGGTSPDAFPDLLAVLS